MPPSLVRLVRKSFEGDGKTVLVLLHGLGSNETDLMQIGEELDPRLTVVTLRAPSPYAIGGYTWFPLQWDASGIRICPEDVISSVRDLTEELRSLRQEVQPRKLILGGFSQGAIMTVGVACLAPDLLDGAISMSGRFLPELLSGADVSTIPFLVQHGIYDDVLDPEGSRQLVSVLREQGANVEAHEYPMGHEVSWPSIRHLDAWIRARIDG